MRAILVAVFVSLTGAASAHDYWQSDNLLECLVGKGVVELRHGATPKTAIIVANEECKSQVDPPPKNTDGVDYTEAIQGTAYQILIQAAEQL